MNTNLAHILYVDDEEFNLTTFRATFRTRFEVHTALSAEEGMAVLAQHPIEVVVTDQRMPGTTGVEFLESVQKVYPNPIRMVLTGFADIESIISSINKGQVYRYITKPWDEDEVRMILESAVETFRLRDQNRLLLEHLARYNEELEETVKQRTADLKKKSEELETISHNAIEQNKLITRLNREKADMLAIAGEDLQQPLKDILRTASHGLERIAKITPSDAEAHFTTIHRSAMRIHGVLENLLLLNAIEKTGIRVYPTHLDPMMIVKTVALSHQTHASAKDIQIELERTGSFDMVHTDPNGIQTIMDHLLSNAVKFSPPGSVVNVVVHVEGKQAVISVADTGPGFTEADKPQIFTKFATLSAKPTAGELSTGLGLSIVKSYVDALSGTVELDETNKVGAKFIVHLPSIHR